jgi:hypothetical protein
MFMTVHHIRLVPQIENVLECVFHNFETVRKQKDIACRGWVLSPRPPNYYRSTLKIDLLFQP